ncbi:MAG: putative transposase [bacterium]
MGSLYLTKELFHFEKVGNKRKLFIGTKTNNLGYLDYKSKGSWNLPNSIYIKRKNGKFTVSFCYQDHVKEEKLLTLRQHLKQLSNFSEKQLEQITVGIDRGIKRPVQSGKIFFTLTPEQKKKKHGRDKHIKKYQKKLAKQPKGSKRRDKTKKKIGDLYESQANLRRDFCHQTSRKLVDSKEHHVIVFEDLKTKNMSKSSKGTKENPGKNVKQKSGLNRGILDQGWHILESFTKYKAFRVNKAFFKISAAYTSQECADCGNTQSENRKTQSEFICQNPKCGAILNADENASLVIKKRAIKLIQNSRTELTSKGYLRKCQERGASGKSSETKVSVVRGVEALKKTVSDRLLPINC